MRTTTQDTEKFLCEMQCLRRTEQCLLRDLKNIEERYDREIQPSRHVNYAVVIQKSRINRSPVEEATIVLVDTLGKDVKDTKHRLTVVQEQMSDIYNTVERAELTAEENEYVDLRYYTGYSAEMTEQKMCRTNTDRIRKRVLEKVEEARK